MGPNQFALLDGAIEYGARNIAEYEAAMAADAGADADADADADANGECDEH